MPTHAPDRAPVSDPAAGSSADPADPDTLLDAPAPPPADPVGPLAAPVRLRVRPFERRLSDRPSGRLLRVCGAPPCRGGWPGRRRPHGDHDSLAPVPVGDHRKMLGGVDDDDVGRGQGRRVEPAQEEALDAPRRPAAREAAVGGGVGGEDEVVEEDARTGVERAGQEHVEVPEVADEDRVWRALAAIGPAPRGDAPPRGREPARESRRGPGVLQRPDAVGGADAERFVQLSHGVPPSPQPREDHSRARMDAHVVGSQAQDPHGSPSPSAGA